MGGWVVVGASGSMGGWGLGGWCASGWMVGSGWMGGWVARWMGACGCMHGLASK